MYNAVDGGDDLIPAWRGKQGFMHISDRREVAMQWLDIGDPRTREALVVDPGDEVSRIWSYSAGTSAKVKAIVSNNGII